jgi:hypothetical protein
MKRILFTAIAVALSVATNAEIKKEVASEIRNVTVYRQGAQVSREAAVNLAKGQTALLLKGLPAKINPESIQAKADNDVMILSVTHSIDYLNKIAATKEITSLRNRQRTLTDSIKMLRNYLSVYNQEKDMILANKSIAGTNGVKTEELEQAAAFFRKRLTEIENLTGQIENRMFLLRSELIDVSKQLLEQNAKVDLPASTITIVVSSEKDTRSNIELSYFISDAGWTPAYDIRIRDVNEPLSLFYKAKVSQNTDENWDNIHLTLSTGNPSLGNDKPELTDYYLTFNNYYNVRTNAEQGPQKPFMGQVMGRITDAATGEPLPGATILAKGTTNGAISDINGNYLLTLPQGSNTVIVSYIGCKSQEVVVTKQTVDVALIEDLTQLQEVVVVGYGVRDDGEDKSGSLQGRAAGVELSKRKEQIPLAIEKRQLTTEFQIKTPYSVPSDNQPYDVTMVQYDIDVQYSYSAVPKLSNDAFLVARIPDFYKYNLLTGTAHVFLKGVYQGESYLDMDTQSDTLNLSVGRDKDIIVSRDIKKEYVSKGLAGSTRKDQKAWIISVKNNKDIPVNIKVEDQYPVSKTDDIKVELIEQSGARTDKSSGKLTWELSLAPKEKKELSLIYSVKYPAGRTLIVE